MSSPERHRVVVTVGTDHHPFDRLVGWIDAWAAAHPDVAVLVQRGTTAAPQHAESVEMLGYDDLVAAMAAADAVVAQGGPAAIMDARSVGHRPIVAPRTAALGEHVDDHQIAFIAWMAERELVWRASDAEELTALLDRALLDPGALRIPPDARAAEATITRFRAVVDPLLQRRH
ncbi:glycosyltransferase [soil metagenome]